MSDLIKFKKGVAVNLPTLNLAEPALTTDEERLYLGGNSGNIALPNKQDIDAINTQLAEMTKFLSNFPIIIPETDDTARLNRAIANLNTDETLLFRPNETLNISGKITCKPNTIIDANGGKVNFSGTGICFDCTFSDYAGVKFKNLAVIMTLGSTTQIAFNLYKFNNYGSFEHVSTYGGAYGIKSVNSYMWKIDDLYMTNPSYAGLYHQGDDGSEFNWRDLYISIHDNFTGKYGIEIERTTSTDVGGYYLFNCLVVVNKSSGGFLEQGIYIHSSSVSVATVVFNMDQGGADGFSNVDATNGYYALKLENVGAVRLSNTWTMSVGLFKTEQTVFGNSNIAYGFYFRGTGNVSNAFLASNISCGEYQAFTFDSTATVSNFYHKNIRQHPSYALCDNMSKITSGYNTHFNKIFTDPINANGAFCIENASDSTKKKFFRIDSFGALIMLDGAFANQVLEIKDWGSINVMKSAGTYSVAGTQVLSARKIGWTVPTGTALRTGFDTTTATTTQLAQTLKALIDDLTSHGLIGS